MNYKIKEEVLWKLVDGEAVMVNPLQEKYLYLNSTGTEIWKLLDSGRTAEEITRDFICKYEVDEDVALKDIKEIIRELLQNGLIEEVENGR